MRLTTMITQLQRICDELYEMETAGKAYRAPTHDRLGEIAILANKIVGYAQKAQRCAITGEADMCVDVNMPLTDRHDTDCSAVQSLQPFIKAVQQILEQGSNATPEGTKAKHYDISHRPTLQIPSIITECNTSTAQGVHEATIYSVNDKLSPNDMDDIRAMPNAEKSAMCRQITSVYHSKLLQLSKRAYEYDCISQLAKLIWDWYSVRIAKNRQYNCMFRYSVRRIKNIIYSIIIAYGYHMELGDINNFVVCFYDWLKLLGSDKIVTDKYAAPYEIYDIEINHTCIYANVTAMVLSDLLWDFGFSEISSSITSKSFVYFSPYGVSMLTEELSPTVAEKYRDYKADPDVLIEVGIA